MQYLGGKARISKPLSHFLTAEVERTKSTAFVDLFCGACNVVSKIPDDIPRYANDKHPYLIAMWEALQQGWEPPSEVSEQEYRRLKADPDSDPALAGFVGFGCSFAGRWFEGYARSGDKNFAAMAKRSIAKKMATLQDVTYECCDYTDVVLPHGALAYCDIPYKDTKPYCSKLLGKFDHDRFWAWAEVQNNPVYVSEYACNVSRTPVWSLKSRRSLRAPKAHDTEEVLIRV